MLELIRGGLGLLIEIVTLIGGIASLGVAYMKKRSTVSKATVRQRWFLLGGTLLAIALVVLTVRVSLPKSSLAIAGPIGSVEVVQPDLSKGSVTFSVSGSSANVPTEKCVYVLVKAASEWHVQECVQVDESGNWSLPKAWIGDSSCPISKGSVIDLMAIVAGPGLEKDRKLTHPHQATPDATSRPVRVKVQSFQLASVQASME